MESNSIKGSNNNIQRMYTSLHEETSTETDSLNDKQLTNGSRSPHENGDSSKLNSASRRKQSHNDDSSRSPHSDNGSTRSTPSQKV